MTACHLQKVWLGMIANNSNRLNSKGDPYAQEMLIIFTDGQPDLHHPGCDLGFG